jgi:hypothetical protein
MEKERGKGSVFQGRDSLSYILSLGLYSFNTFCQRVP